MELLTTIDEEVQLNTIVHNVSYSYKTERTNKDNQHIDSHSNIFNAERITFNKIEIKPEYDYENWYNESGI